MMSPKDFLETLQGLQFPHTFNPYTHRCAVHDLEDAPRLRSQGMVAILEAATKTDIEAIWIGRDLGYRGGRRTGLALTDDIHLGAHAQRWGVPLERPTKGQPVAERTAAILWSILLNIDAPVFLWNVFPLHSHDPREPFSNRPHDAREGKAGEEVLGQLIRLLEPRRLVAIGKEAGLSARRLAGNQQVVQVRHPSYGGQALFLKQLRELYDLPDEAPRDQLFQG